MEDLPAELTIDILSRLPVKTIIVHCKRVCKKWQNLVSDSYFVNLHLSKSHPTGVIIHHHRDEEVYKDPGILKWVEIENKVDDLPMSLDLNMVPVFQNSLIDQMGSVNGLIFLWQNSRNPKSDDIYICNPVTREILILPTPQYHRRGFGIVAYGFGVSTLTGEYKVVRTIQGGIPLNGNKYKVVSEAEVYTLGTGQWRSVGRAPYLVDNSDFGVVLNDHCHWIVVNKEGFAENISTFDLNKEMFQLFPSPPNEVIEESYSYFQSLAVLKGCLCKSYAYHQQFTIWVMKEYGVEKSWHKEVVITEPINLGLEEEAPVSLIEGLKDGSILIFSEGNLWVFYPRSDTIERIEMFDYSVSGLAYRPSFLRLQNFESQRVHTF